MADPLIIGSKTKVFVEDKDNFDYTVRKYVSITCAKVIDSDVSGTKDVMEDMLTDLMVVEGKETVPVAREEEEKDTKINDRRREPKEKYASPAAYKIKDRSDTAK